MARWPTAVDVEDATWWRLPQSFVESLKLYAVVLKRDLDDLHLPGRSTLLQRSAECGHRASLDKVQFCWAEVTYTGDILKDGQCLLSPERVKLLVNMSPPRTKKDMLSFLGMVKL